MTCFSGIGVFLGSLRLKEAGFYFEQPNPADLAQGKAPQTSSTKPPAMPTEPPIQSIKSGQKRPADTTDDNKASKVPRLSEPQGGLKSDPFPARLREAIFNALGGTSKAEAAYLNSVINNQLTR